MKKTVLDETTKELIRTEDSQPSCGEDCCSGCGDCLDCYIEDPCYDNDMGSHTWVVYEEPAKQE